ncbi:MAG: tRNA uridine(34) 5-carboxymethylaminomethyl modification radical SAM/GNAT enzyme Elp3 [Nanobdellota archaeon]
MQDEKIKKYYEELISSIKEKEKNKKRKLSKEEVNKLKTYLAGKYSLKKQPRDMDILLSSNIKDYENLLNLRCKPTRSLSGVAVIAVMTKPFPCPHGKCVFCPGGKESFFGETPQSYTGKEPSTRRAIRNEYDPFLIVFNRLEQYTLSGHNPSKADCIIMGGTFPSYPIDYQLNFIIDIYLAMNIFGKIFFNENKINSKRFREWFELPHDPEDPEIQERLKKKMKSIKNESLNNIYKKFGKTKKSKRKIIEYLKRKNESSGIRCIGITQETRPDYCLEKHCNEMLEQGVTRVELGVQTIFDKVLEKSGRGHSIQDSIKATKILKDLGFKVNYHMMIGMPGSDRKKDIESLKKIFLDDSFKPDMLKIYPCLVMEGTEIYDSFVKGNYKPYNLDEAVEIISEGIKNIPKYCRIMRIQRDIPSTLVKKGVNHTNLKQYIDNYMQKKGIKLNDIRTREIGRYKGDISKLNFSVKVIEYEASGGKEFFIYVEDKEVLLGFCRLRFVSSGLRKEFTENTAIIRELHVYGSALGIGQKSIYADSEGQHKGWGKKLIKKAEEIALKENKDKMLIISGVGVRGYYRKLGYRKQGPYMGKKLK